ncbi:MAG: hypothetical protein IJ240_10390 [Clostridia bacterium]|nr:hypothetical protein [Clostridia bacterium]
METTGKSIQVHYLGKCLRLYNQRCRDWSHDYGYLGSQATLSNAGCGIFSIANAVSWMSGMDIDVDVLAQFSIENGGRGDDGTDRPALLHAMSQFGLATAYGFSYHEDGLRNDLDVLFEHLNNGGTGLGNLRVGHIVALLSARILGDERQILAADPYSESADERICNQVRECVRASAVVSAILNDQNQEVGFRETYALYWVPLSQVHDFNLLHPLV